MRWGAQDLHWNLHWNLRSGATRWCPSSLAKLVQISPISLWFMADITIVNGVYKPTNITGGHHPAMNNSWWLFHGHWAISIPCIHEPMWVSCSTLFWCQATQQMSMFWHGLLFLHMYSRKNESSSGCTFRFKRRIRFKTGGFAKKRIQSKLKTYCSTSEKKIRKKQVIRSAPFPTSKNSGRSHCPRRCCLSHTVWLATLPSHITPYIHR